MKKLFAIASMFLMFAAARVYSQQTAIVPITVQNSPQGSAVVQIFADSAEVESYYNCITENATVGIPCSPAPFTTTVGNVLNGLTQNFYVSEGRYLVVVSLINDPTHFKQAMVFFRAGANNSLVADFNR